MPDPDPLPASAIPSLLHFLPRYHILPLFNDNQQSFSERSMEAAADNPMGDSSSGRPAKRNRITVACTWCRSRKSRCDGMRPACSTCHHHGYACEYADTASLTRLSGSKELVALEARLAETERYIAGLEVRLTGVEAFKDEVTGSSASSRRRAPEIEGNDATTADSQDPTDGIGSVVFTKEEEAGFFGPSSNIAFTRLIVRTTTAILKTALTSSPMSPSDAALQSHMLHVSRQTSPMSHRSPPHSTSSPNHDLFYLPQEAETLSLIDIFFNTTGVLFPYIAKDSFLSNYHHFNSTNIRTARRSWLGLLNMVLAMATSASHVSTLSAAERAVQSDMYFRRALTLCEKQIRHGTSLEMVQMLLLMSQYLQGTERSIETWNIHGLAVKAAYQLGLHSPNALKKYPPLEREIRKRTWFGCIVVDRTLSMTLGRPSAIPQNFIKLDLPAPWQLCSESNAAQQLTEQHSVNFFNATITLYAIMGEILDDLYGSNLGCDLSDHVFNIASQLLQVEQKLLMWQQCLPPTLILLQSESLGLENIEQDTLRYRFVLTMRFLNLRILAHRPLLCKYLEYLGTPKPDAQQLAILGQVGINSLRICAQSAITIINLMRAALAPQDPPRHLLGAWWFSLYYTFNAALVIYSTLLAQHQIQMSNQQPILEGIELSIDSLYEAIECLSMLFKGNRMTEKCARYTTSLAQILSHIYQTNGTSAVEPAVGIHPHTIRDLPVHQRTWDAAQAPITFDFTDLNDIHMGMSLDNLFAPDFDFNTPLESVGLQ